MFQYAMARALALRCDAPLQLDTRFYLTHRPWSPPRLYLLDRFRLPDGVTEAARYPPFPSLDKDTAKNWGIATQCAQFPSLDSRSAATRLRRWCTNYCIEQQGFFNHSAMSQPSNAYILGFWQRFGYFEDAQDAIRSDFQLRQPPDAHNQSLLDRIAAADCAVGVHVRRTDLLKSKHGVQTIDYYRKAIRLIERRGGARATLFAFSDDCDWVRSNLRLDREMHVSDHNDAATGPPEDLRLMAACDHFVLANSTFSFWAAYLGAASGKIVVASLPFLLDRSITWHATRPLHRGVYAITCQ